MKKIVLTFGLSSGAIICTVMAIMVPLSLNGTDLGKSEIVGYASMVLAFLLVFFGIRSYRENVGGGTITFGKAFQVGILITLVTCVMYVTTWEIVYYNFLPDFADRYAARSIEHLRAEGATDAAILAATEKMAQFKRLYANPLYNVGLTFLEIFPVGLIVTLISAAILRRRDTPAPAMA
jgi:hypothetical protein